MPTLTSHHFSSMLTCTLPCPLASLPGTRVVVAGARVATAWTGPPGFASPSRAVTHRQREGQCCSPLARHQQDLLLHELILIRASRACTHHPRSLCYLKGTENNWKEDTCLESVPCQLPFLCEWGSGEYVTHVCLSSQDLLTFQLAGYV